MREGVHKRMRRLAAWMVSCIAVAWLALHSLLWLGNSRPGGDYVVPGLVQTLVIHFDDRLRPWVEATSLDDALAAQGWLHARYRLWQMELLRRAGRGRLAEAFGVDVLESDRALWRVGVPQLAANLETAANPDLLRAVDAYLSGVNAALGALRARPPEFWLLGLRPAVWTRRDVFAVGAIIAYQSAGNQDNELLRLALQAALDSEHFALFLPDETIDADFPYAAGNPPPNVDLGWLDALDSLDAALLPSAALGSSGWVVAPSRSASGHALFAFDSHDDLTLPSLFYEVHLFYGPRRSIRGWSLPGLPGVINGFNHYLAWGLTNIGDTQDLFHETRHPERPTWFEMDGSWYEAHREDVEIPVKGWERPDLLTIWHTRNGPLVSENPPLTLRWTGHDLAGRGLEALLAMNTASNIEAFQAALDRHGAPSANVTYADVEGHILFRTIGLLPIRGAGRGLVPLAGNRSVNGWQSIVADRDLPMRLDPSSGYVAAANARVSASPPLISADNAAGYRMRRLRDVLSARRDFRLDDMQALQLDFHNSQAQRLLPALLPDLDGLDAAAEQAAAGLLRAWSAEPRNAPDSAGALLWEHWYPELARDVFGPALTPDLLQRLLRQNYVLNHALDRLVLHEPASPWWRGQRVSILRDSFRRVVAQLSEAAGHDPTRWRWDTVQRVSFRHELDGAVPLLGHWLSRGPWPWGGGHPVLGRARYGYDRPFLARSGATVRVVAEMAESAPRVRSILSGGQHGHPGSPQYDDQLESWLAGRLDPLPDRPEVIDGPVTRLLPRVTPP